MMRNIILIFLVFLFTGGFLFSQSENQVWEGTASMSRFGEFPATGYYAASNSFARNTIVDVENLLTGKKANIIITDRLNNPGLFMLLSKQAAEAIGIAQGETVKVRVTLTRESDITAGSIRSDSAYIQDPDINPAAAVRAITGKEPESAEPADSGMENTAAENTAEPVQPEVQPETRTAAAEQPEVQPAVQPAEPEVPEETRTAAAEKPAVESTGVEPPKVPAAEPEQPEMQPVEPEPAHSVKPDLPKQDNTPAIPASPAAPAFHAGEVPVPDVPETAEPKPAEKPVLAELSGEPGEYPEPPPVTGPLAVPEAPDAAPQPKAAAESENPPERQPGETAPEPDRPRIASIPEPFLPSAGAPVSVGEIAEPEAPAEEPSGEPVKKAEKPALAMEIPQEPEKAETKTVSAVLPPQPDLNVKVTEMNEAPPEAAPEKVPSVETVPPEIKPAEKPPEKPDFTIPEGAKLVLEPAEPRPPKDVTPKAVEGPPSAVPSAAETEKKLAAESVSPPHPEAAGVKEEKKTETEEKPAPADKGTKGIIDSLVKGAFYVQLGVYDEARNAERVAEKYRVNFPVSVYKESRLSGFQYKVMLGPVNEDETGGLLYNFRAKGFKDAFIRKVQ